MALSKGAVARAYHILTEINPKAKCIIQDFDKENEFALDQVIGLDEKSDGGWENVFMNVKNITPVQLALFNAKKNSVPNSSFCREHPERGITRIGWF